VSRDEYLPRSIYYDSIFFLGKLKLTIRSASSLNTRKFYESRGYFANGSIGEIFLNLKKLQNYTIKTEKYFPKENIYAGGLLRFLFREILHSYAG
jgi:hypothetical protein